MRLGSAGEPFRWYSSQPPKKGPLTSHFWRLPSAVMIKAPFLVPTRTRTLLTACSFQFLPSPRGGGVVVSPLRPGGRGAGGEGARPHPQDPLTPNPSPTRGEGDQTVSLSPLSPCLSPLSPRGRGAGGEGDLFSSRQITSSS